MWFWKPKKSQLDRIEDKCDWLIVKDVSLTVAYDELTAAVAVAVTDIAALAAKINTQVVNGTSDADLAVLTGQLKAATDAVVAVLTPAA